MKAMMATLNIAITMDMRAKTTMMTKTTARARIGFFLSSFAAMMISSRRRYHSPPKKRKDLSTCKKYFIIWLSWCFDSPASSATCSVVFETLQSQRLINWFLFFVRSKPLFSWSVASETWKKLIKQVNRHCLRPRCRLMRSRYS